MAAIMISVGDINFENLSCNNRGVHIWVNSFIVNPTRWYIKCWVAKSATQPTLLIKIADGAADNWRFLSDTLFPGKGVELLDYFHASDPLNDAMEAAYGKGSAMAIAKYQEYKSLLKNEIGGIEKVINTLKYHSQKKNRKMKS